MARDEDDLPPAPSTPPSPSESWKAIAFSYVPPDIEELDNSQEDRSVSPPELSPPPEEEKSILGELGRIPKFQVSESC